MVTEDAKRAIRSCVLFHINYANTSHPCVWLAFADVTWCAKFGTLVSLTRPIDSHREAGHGHVVLLRRGRDLCFTQSPPEAQMFVVEGGEDRHEAKRWRCGCELFAVRVTVQLKCGACTCACCG